MPRVRPAVDQTVPSPCIAQCKVDKASQHCTGCLRTLDEIRDWRIMDAAAKRATLQRIGIRRNAPAA